MEIITGIQKYKQTEGAHEQSFDRKSLFCNRDFLTMSTYLFLFSYIFIRNLLTVGLLFISHVAVAHNSA